MTEHTTGERPQPTHRDRLVTTLFFAVLIHGVVILGVGFSAEDRTPSRGRTLEVTVVQAVSDEAPEEADYIAQADQRGEGNTREKTRPQTPMATPTQMENPGLEQGNEADTRSEMSLADNPPDTLEAEDPPPEVQQQVLTEAESAVKAATSPTPPPNARPEKLVVAKLVTSGIESTEPVSERNQEPVARSDNPREKFISVNTRESKYAGYLERWRRQVEKLGNVHYPDEARRQGLEGSLSIEVAINADGSLAELVPHDRSRHPVLDEAAARTVRLAAPFPPFPEEIREETDVLRFVYRWEFGADGGRGRVTTRSGEG